MKTCKTCGVEKPLDQFRTARRNVMGVMSNCKACMSRGPRRRQTTDAIEKACSACHEIKPFSAFRASSDGLYGFHARCTECMRKISATRGLSYRDAGHQLSEKRCTKCGEIKSSEQFSKLTTSSSGLQSRCKACKSTRKAKPPSLLPADMKECTECRTVKGLDQFDKDPRYEKGVRSWCKACYAGYHRKRSKVPPRHRRTTDSGIKSCRICGEAKAFNAFSPQAKGLYGLHAKCKACAAKLVAASNQAHRNAGRPALIEKQCGRCTEIKPAAAFNKGTGPTGLSAYCRDCAKAQKAEWIAEDPEAYRLMGTVHASKRRARVLNATPAWLGPAHWAEVEGFYFFCTLFPGHHVDHVVPLQGKNVCGLHAPNNMQILTADENFRKNNRHG